MAEIDIRMKRNPTFVLRENLEVTILPNIRLMIEGRSITGMAFKRPAYL